jgi:hypothetical protein
MQATFIVEGVITRRPETDVTRNGKRFTQFEISNYRTWTDSAGKTRQSDPMVFDIICWGELAREALKLAPRTTVVVNGSRLIPYDNNGTLGLKMFARDLSVTLRDVGSQNTGRGQRSGDLVTSPHGETVAVEAWPDIVGDLETVHRGR